MSGKRKQLKNYQLDLDIVAAINAEAAAIGLNESEIVRRLLRLALRKVKEDRGLLVSREASEELKEFQPPG